MGLDKEFLGITTNIPAQTKKWETGLYQGSISLLYETLCKETGHRWLLVSHILNIGLTCGIYKVVKIQQ